MAASPRPSADDKLLRTLFGYALIGHPTSRAPSLCSGGGARGAGAVPAPAAGRALSRGLVTALVSAKEAAGSGGFKEWYANALQTSPGVTCFWLAATDQAAPQCIERESEVQESELPRAGRKPTLQIMDRRLAMGTDSRNYKCGPKFGGFSGTIQRSDPP